MYLKALEIQGFKSFPDKTVLNFGEDITAIVGPNGSGKSNISDAISWVMGEQSARTLRGGKMEDVIFGGTEKRGPVGFAQVTLVLDNTQRIFPSIDASEVMVTRRYYRSGESEYYINKQSVRLKDVSELFMDTGLGREGYALIGQGRIDEILSVRSTDRREIFEEAAGISRFRHRKEEAERKLQRTEENLVRVGDKISELELQVEPLREQAEKAKRFLILRDELRLLEISLWLNKLDELRAGAVKLQTDCAQAKERKDAAGRRLEELYRENDAFSQRMQENDLAQERVREEAGSLEQEAADRDSAVAALKTTLQHSRESIALLERELSEQDSRRETILAQNEEQRRRIENIEERRTVLEGDLAALLQRIRETAEKAGSAGEEASALNARETLASEELSQLRQRQSALSAGVSQMEERSAAVERERGEAQARLDNARREEEAARRALEEAQEEAKAAANVMEGYGIRIEKRTRRKEAAEEAFLQLTMEQNNLLSRIHMLSEMEKEYEGFNKAVRVVMQASEKNTLRGIHGPVANLMKVEGRCALALEIALGAGLQNIVVDREETAKAAIGYLKQRDAGRATFLPLTAIRGEALREEELAGENGFVGVASRLIRFEPRYEQIFQNLLGRTVVVEDLDCGIAMARRHQNRFRIVTLDGQVINRGGSMTGGSVSRTAGILSRANELEALRARQGTLSEKLAGAQRERDEAARELAAARYELETAEGQRRQAEDEALRRQGEVERCRTLRESLTGNQENLEGEAAALSERIRETKEQIEALNGDISRQEGLLEALRRQAEEKLSGQSELLTLSNRLGEEMAGRKEELAALSAEEETTRRALEDMERVRLDMEGDRSERLKRVEEYKASMEATETEIGKRTEEAAALRLRGADLRRRLDLLREERMKLEQERGAMGGRIKEINDEVLDAERQAAALEQKLSAGEWEEKQLLDKLWETYELSHADASSQRIELESVPKANRRVGELKREIGGLGNVNVGAIEEFDRVNERYTYLTGQREDIQQAKGELVGIIEQITREMTAIFTQQFEKINEAFQETFRDLFGGGKATLELEDREQILECGIEIRVQPPGKTLRTLTLLSGGEKAFVAIALYFAILKVHPTPFCVMDEIEAALDDANVVRFAQYMRRICDKTQFIAITHRRGTMEEADILYGVTMQEKGVSKVLTINLNDVAKELNIK